MVCVEGQIERIIYQNEENGYKVFELNEKKSEKSVTCVGSFSFLSEGEYVRLTGDMVNHSLYGSQLQVKTCEFIEPAGSDDMERYLASGAIKGVGKALAKRIVKEFGDATFEVMEKNPEALSSVKGISPRMAREIGDLFAQKKEMRSAMVFLSQYGITQNLALKIYAKYGSAMYEVMEKNPYRLAEDIAGVGFKTADAVAARAGIDPASEYRIRAGVLYTLSQASANGHTYLPEPELIEMAASLLEVDPGLIGRQLDRLSMEKKIIIKDDGDERAVYSAILYYSELGVARMLHDLNISYSPDETKLADKISAIEKKSGIVLDDMQRKAVSEAVKNGLFVLTGGPGTGKTTTINALIRFFESEGFDILLAAPTGRAAKRMTETTGHEARTIHRLLELSGNIEEDRAGYHFERDESNPLETDVVIIDEMSMVDISLMHALLKAVSVGTRLILVGDENQLPSVGAGNVLSDIIASGCFNVVRLEKIFRQAAESDIVVNAHRINNGESIAMDNKSKDFFFLERGNLTDILGIIVMLVRDKMPGYVGAKPFEIQVLTPMRKGELGVENLNRVLQKYLNPPDSRKFEKEYQQTVFREGDKVMQIKNNYQLEWNVMNKYGIPVESGLGVFNGDCGVIKAINDFASTVTVEYDEGRVVDYPYSMLDELELAYAVTIHKSQGSEYPAVVIPLLTGPKMLFTRNLLYTAVTRAKSCVTIVGKSDTVNFMIGNESEQKRYSGLCRRLEEIS